MSKNGPNKTVAEFRRKNPRPRTPREPDAEMKEVMDAVSRGEMTPAEGAARVQEMMNKQKG